MKLGVVGLGRFGRLWAEALQPFGEVLAYEKSTLSVSPESSIKPTPLAEVAQADIIFLLVPISEFANCCEEIKKWVKPTSLIVDACSVKIYPAIIMQRVFTKQQLLIATHPLFGPDSVKKTGGLHGHKIVVCPLQADNDQQQLLISLLEKMGLIISITTPDEHDKQMATSQGLVHFIGRGLMALDLHPQKFSTPDFQALLNINQMVNNDTWQLFLDMQRYNPYTAEMRLKLIKQLGMLNQQIEEQKNDDHREIARKN